MSLFGKLSGPGGSLDRVGIIASAVCALHCALAPLVIIVSPIFGGWWANPISHVTIAALVLPVAAVALFRGFARHRQRRIVLLGVVGVTLVAVAAILPWLTPTAAAAEPAVAVAETAEGEAPKESCGSCCPRPEVDQDTGEWSLKFPPASILSLLGGAPLIAAHVGNRYCCVTCD